MSHAALDEPDEPDTTPPPAGDVGRLVTDAARLAALRATGLLDSAAEPAFDRLTRLAARLVGAPIAFFSLVDERRDFYKSACGIGDALGGGRELTGPTFCQFAIQGREPLVIPDTAADPRYSHVPTVVSLGVAAYVGVPVAVDGQVIGSFCVVDHVPRAWTADEVDTLRELAASAEREIGFRAAVHAGEQLAAELEEQASELTQQMADARAAGEALERERSRLQDVFAQAPTFLCVLRGPDHVFALANESYYRLVGRRDLIGRPIADALPELREQGFLALLDGVRTSGEPYVGREMAIRLARTEGVEPELRHVDFVYLPLVEGAGELAGVIAHGSDVTDSVAARHEVERLLAWSEQARHDSDRARADADLARAAAEQANRTQAAFLGTMSHEFRTPLNAIGGYAQLLALEVAGPLTPAQRDHLARLQASNAHMLGLVNDVLDLARLDADALPVRADAGMMATAVADALPLVEPQAAAHGVALVDETSACEVPYVGDDQRVRQIVVNLLSNAVKFSESGRAVRVSCAVADRAPPSSRLGDGPWALLEVCDAGVGIAPEFHAAVFEPFKQVDGARTRTRGGTGLGLAISRRLARIMGGDLTLESIEGRGSTFRVWLPAGKSTPVATADARANRATPRSSVRTARGLSDIGHRLRDDLEAMLDAWSARLRADDAFPRATSLPVAQLEDHTLPFLANVVQALIIVEQTGGLDGDLMRDCNAIQRITSECHGRQRRRLGWTEAQLAREYGFLLDELVGRIGRYAPRGSDDASLATGIVTRLVAHSRDAAVRAFTATSVS